MPEAQVIERPRRWDLPFSHDLPDLSARGEIGDADLARLMEIEPFRSMDPARFPRTIPLEGILRNDTRVRSFRHGDVVVRQGDYGNSAFLILKGRVRVILEGLDPIALGRRGRRRRSWLRSIARLVTNPKSPEVRDAGLYPQRRESEEAGGRGGPIPVQDVTNVIASVPDAFETTNNSIMREGELFGELAALGRIPRSATVAADGEVDLLEIRWQGLRDLRKFDESLRRHTDEQYRRFGLAATLRASPLLAHLDERGAAAIAEVAEFETYGQFDWYGSYQALRREAGPDVLAHEPLIAEEGHYPNGLILIRAGFARLSRRQGSGEQTFGYLGKGDVFGLRALVHNAAGGEPVGHSGSLRAVGYVDVVRIPARAVQDLILPGLPAERLAAQRTASPSIDPEMMEFLVENRFINGTATMMIDLERCTRCDDCVRACASGHDNNPRFIRHGPVMGHHMVANACMHCVDPVCMIGCPTGAIHRDEERGEVVINDITCIGCSTCAASCPYDNIRMVEVRDRDRQDAIMIDPGQGKAIVKATKCDLCIDHPGGPACQRACPHDALIRVDMRDTDLLSQWLVRS